MPLDTFQNVTPGIVAHAHCGTVLMLLPQRRCRRKHRLAHGRRAAMVAVAHRALLGVDVRTSHIGLLTRLDGRHLDQFFIDTGAQRLLGNVAFVGQRGSLTATGALPR